MGKASRRKRDRITNVMAVNNCDEEQAKKIIRFGKAQRRYAESQRKGLILERDAKGNITKVSVNVYRPNAGKR